jgi:trehalose 6-phosphate phosphatase
MTTEDLPAAQPGWAYFLDLDGTLLDIAPDPNLVHIDRELVQLLERLHHVNGGAVALVSGRALSDLDRRLSPLTLPRAGQHGLERRDARGIVRFHSGSPDAKERIREALLPLLGRHPALGLEDKGLTLAVHYRQAPHLEDVVIETMNSLVAESRGVLVLQKGKCVAEAKPAHIDKGTAIDDYLAEKPFIGRRPVFIGDDLNDEGGFAAINRVDGISIKVGMEDSCARYRLPGVAAVRAWLAGALIQRQQPSKV